MYYDHILQIDADKEFNFVARAYLEPPTKVGPDGSELLMPYVLYVSILSAVSTDIAN